MTPNSRRRLVAAAIGGLLTITACSSDGEDTVSSQDSLDAATPDEDDVTEVGEAESTFEEPTSNDVDCSDEGLGADDMISFTAAHHVVDGELGALCNGAGDERIFEAWDALATIAPRGQLGDLGVFTAFEESGAGDEITLAFVQPLDADGTVFQMSINLDEYEFDPDEALLTMAHEFSHVFTATPAQIDRSVEAAETCTTYDNGEGCFLEDSLIFQWVDTFWVDYIDDFDHDRLDLADHSLLRSGGQLIDHESEGYQRRENRRPTDHRQVFRILSQARFVLHLSLPSPLWWSSLPTNSVRAISRMGSPAAIRLVIEFDARTASIVASAKKEAGGAVRPRPPSPHFGGFCRRQS